MKIEEVLAKVAKGEDLSDEEKVFAGDYTSPDMEATINARMKKERKKDESKIADLQESVKTLNEALEETQATDTTESDKLNKAIERANKTATDLQVKYDAEIQAHAVTNRNNALKGVKVPWMDDVATEYRDLVLNKAFDGIDTEDLRDQAVLAPIIEKVMSEQASFINSGKTGGAGTGASEVGKKLISTSKRWTREAITQAQQDGSFAEHRGEIMAAME